MAKLDLHHEMGGQGAFAPGGSPLLETSPWPSVAPDPHTHDDEELCFRGYRLLPRSRMLLCDGRPVEIGSRAFDLLHVLLGARGTLVPKDEIVDRVWPATVVDDCNLRFQVAVLRKALGDDRDLIKTVSGRGYLFVAEPGATGLAGVQPESRRWPEGHAAAARVDGADTETLRGLLRSVLDELWQMTQRGDRTNEPSFSPVIEAAATHLRR